MAAADSRMLRAARASPALMATRCSGAGSASVDAAAVAAGVAQRPVDDGAHVVVGERLQAEDAQPRQERRVDLEVGVLRRRADERDDALLDVRQQGVLLGLVEAVDLVDEEDRGAAAAVDPVARLGDRGAHLLDAAGGRREHVETRADRLRQQSRERRLAHPGGPQSTMEASRPRSTMRRSAPRSPTSGSWPTNSARSRGRMRAARGAWPTSARKGSVSGRASPRAARSLLSITAESSAGPARHGLPSSYRGRLTPCDPTPAASLEETPCRPRTCASPARRPCPTPSARRARGR